MITTISSLFVGIVAAIVSVFALVSSTVGAPDSNPAAGKPVISYGSNS